MIDLCLKVFDWAKFRKRKGAIKLHLILDHAGHIPSFCVMTPGREHEIEVARGQRYEPDSILTFDRAYVGYHWFDQLHRQGVYFVTRQKRNARYRVLERRPVGPQPGVTSDQVIRLTGKAAGCLSTPLRRIGYRDPETRQFYVCVFRTKPATDSGANRPPIPVGNRPLETGSPERWPISRRGGRFPGKAAGFPESVSTRGRKRRWTPSVR